MTQEKVLKLTLDEHLYGQLNQRAAEAGFTAVEDYVLYILQEVTRPEETQEESLTQEQQEEIRQQLKGLGYLE